MAVSFDHPLSNSFLFDIYTDGQPPRSVPTLPSGSCHYTDTTPGANGPRCGCRRFWSRQATATGQLMEHASPSQAMWCMCSHHACYHDEFQPGQISTAAAAAAAAAAPVALPPAESAVGQENERPKANRDPLSPVQAMASFRIPSSLGGSLDLNYLDLPASFSCSDHNLPEAAYFPAGANHDPGAQQQDSSMPDTLSWGDLGRPQQSPPDQNLPPIPPQCLLPSQPPLSTASSSQARYLKPFAGRGLQTLSSVAAGGPQDHTFHRVVGSTPGAAGLAKESTALPDVGSPGSSTNFDSDGAAATPAVAPSPIAVDSVSSTPKGISPGALRRLTGTVQDHGQRLDRLENASFSVAYNEEAQEKQDHTDLRVTELESRVDELEKTSRDNDTSSVGTVRRRDGVAVADDATASVVSVATDATTRTRATDDRSSEMYSQLQVLQTQVRQLQAASAPSFRKPWDLEVVLLPFPLKGIWMGAHEFDSGQSSGLEGTQQLPVPLDQAPASHWLLPRACAPGRIVDRRLRSRGLIKTVSVRGPDARSVQLAINSAFGDIFPLLSRRRAPDHNDNKPAGMLALHQSWVPLRKIHKDSRLRFLSPGEMVTPSLWDVTFLVSSVVMKATGLQRLYITQPEAYMQDCAAGFEALETGRTWQRLRELARVYSCDDASQPGSQGEVPEADALEECWTWNDRLDEAPSSAPLPQPSLSSQLRPNVSLGRISTTTTSSSQPFFTGVQSPRPSASPVALRANSPLTLKDRRGSRPPPSRGASIPPTVPITAGSQPKRRASSYGTNHNPYHYHPPERRPSPLVQRSSPRLAFATPAATTSIRRRQSTRSPSLIPRNTPRWSRSPSLVPVGLAGFGDDRAERRTTPFCYATPYSNAPEPHGAQRAGSRGPPPYFEVDDDNDDDGADDDEFMQDSSADVDVYDSEMTNDADDDDDDDDSDDALAGQRTRGIDVYEDEEARRLQSRYLARQDHGYGQMVQPTLVTTGPLLPEDEPWPGIEDHMSDGENMDPSSGETDDMDGGAENASDASSQPSEYPSTQRAWHVPAKAESGGQNDGQGSADDRIGFKIHEDGDVDITGAGMW